MSQSHTLIYKHSPDGPPSGAAGLLNWIAYDQSGHGFRRRYGVGQVGDLVAGAISQAIERGRNVTVGWGNPNPATASASEREEWSRQLSPRVLICPERRGNARPTG
jgi:hypothetical protein